MGDTPIDELCGDLDESFHIQDDGNLIPDGRTLEEGKRNSHSGKRIYHALDADENAEAEFMSVASPKCSCNCRTSSGKNDFWPVSSDEEDDLCEYLANSTCKVCEYNAYLQSILPKPVKLPSALKGTRAKLGMEPQKLTVRWSLEVHDPPTTSLSHVKNTGQQRTKNTKKNGKSKHKESKQKGKAASRGSSGGGKDKKKFGKFSGNSNRGRVAFDDFDDF